MANGAEPIERIVLGEKEKCFLISRYGVGSKSYCILIASASFIDMAAGSAFFSAGMLKH